MIEGDWRGEDSGKYLVIKEKMLWLTCFFYKKKLAKNQANAKQHLEAEFLLFENYSRSSFTLSSRCGVACSGEWARERVFLFSFHGIVRLVVMGVGGGSGGYWQFLFWRLDWGLGYHYWAFWDFLIFANSLRSRVLSCSATRSYHVYEK